MTKTNDKYKRAFRTFKTMMELDHNTVVEVMAYNNFSLEVDLPEDKELKRRYRKLVAKAKETNKKLKL